MKNIMKIAATTAAFSLLAGTAFAQTAGDSATAVGSASTSVIQAVSLSATTPLSFGTIVKPTSGSGTVTVTAGGARTAAAPVVVAPGSAAATAAAFTVSGDPSRTFSISTPANSNMTDGTNNIAVTYTTSAASGTLSNLGAATFTVGGQMTIADTTVAGSYTGTFSETVQYN